MRGRDRVHPEAVRKIQSLHRILFIPKERENSNKTPNERNDLATKSGFGSRLCKGKVLAPLTSMVFHGNHLLVSNVYGCLFICKLLAIGNEMRDEMGEKISFNLVCSPRIWTLVPTYPHTCNEEVRAP